MSNSTRSGRSAFSARELKGRGETGAKNDPKLAKAGVAAARKIGKAKHEKSFRSTDHRSDVHWLSLDGIKDASQSILNALRKNAEMKLGKGMSVKIKQKNAFNVDDGFRMILTTAVAKNEENLLPSLKQIRETLA